MLLPSYAAVRICLLYDCLFPHTVGGAERWYRNLAERLAAGGHQVTYLTLCQWPRGEGPKVEGVRVVAVGPEMALYTDGGRRRIAPPLRFGLGVMIHLLRHRRDYDVVHTASFPYFSLLAAGLCRPLCGFSLTVDWHEVWSRAYWRQYLGPIAGGIGYAVQLMCARLRQRAFCFSRLHAGRLREEGLRGSVTVLEGEYAGSLEPPVVVAAKPIVVFAGRMIPEKQAPLGVRGVALACRRDPELEGVFFGDGPDRGAVLSQIEAGGIPDRITAPGFVESERVDHALREATCMLLPSRREGYGMVVVEASARGTPSIVIAGEDNAATELIADGVNGVIIAEPDPEAIAGAIDRVKAAGMAMRLSTAQWFTENASRLSLESSLSQVLEAYAWPER